MRKFLWLAAAVIAVGAWAADSTATRVQQTGELLQAATQCQTGTGTAQQTLTFTSSGPNCTWYITNIDNGSGATTAPAATLLTTTSTGLGGWKGYLLQPASATGVVQNVVFANGMRATVGTNVTIVSNAAVTNVNYNLTACGYQICT